jgi:hypothetical protein
MEDSFRKRETQFEAKFAHDEELKFRAVAHRNKLFAAWVIDQMGEAAPPDYADALAGFAFGRNAGDIVARATHDLQARGVAMADVKLWKALEHCQAEAEQDVMLDNQPDIG